MTSFDHLRTHGLDQPGDALARRKITTELDPRSRNEPQREEKLMADLDRTLDGNARIRVVGVGGGGSNAVNRMIRSNLKGVEFIAINTDHQALSSSSAQTSRSASAASSPAGSVPAAIPRRGMEAAEESRDELTKRARRQRHGVHHRRHGRRHRHRRGADHRRDRPRVRAR